MKIEARQVKVADIYAGYLDSGEDGVVAYGGRLDIRPAYQREFVYDQRQAEAVIHTVLKGYPLNVMYWVRNADDRYEVLDGQQRTLSVMQFLSHKYPIKWQGTTYYVDALPDDLYAAICGYEFAVYVCEGSESEKLEWFNVVNIAGAKLTDQELRNSVYTGEWLSDAKRHFSKRQCAAWQLSSKYIKGDPIRQELLELAIRGICGKQGLKDITDYMAAHKSDANADELWMYFQDVIGWVTKIFPSYNSDMKGLDWCALYNAYGGNTYSPSDMAQESKRLHQDDEVQKKKGIYEYLLRRGTDPFAAKLLSLRAFEDGVKRTAYARQQGVCPLCKQHFEYDEMAGDHIKPWSQGGRTVPENCQMLCRHCNAQKSDIY